uniref:ORF1086 n=1 Tax=Spodoptera litura multicapsid nucleopolyhedrovirus TaxID=46242 RepID=Q9E7P2_NPVST|nr:ORF1086 [Spodoptera litura nucleopolyhedrovirus]
MACPANIKVYVSEQFLLFPANYVKPQADVANMPVRNLIVYVPTDADVQYVSREALLGTFDTVLVYRHESSSTVEARAPRKNPNATIVYWNPVLAITEVGVGDTRVFSVLLTNNLYSCNTMVVDTETPLCPIEYHRAATVNANKFTPIAGEDPLYQRTQIMDPNIVDFVICFNRETSEMIKILNTKRILAMLSMRRVRARYWINLPDKVVDSIYSKLNWERVRRLMKGGKWEGQCMLIDRESLRYIRMAQDVLGVRDYARSTLDFVEMFESLIAPYHMVPEIIVKLNSLEGKARVRLYCKNDSYAITNHGIVPNNCPDINPMPFDYSDVNSVGYINSLRKNLFERNNVYDVILYPAYYNYFF